MKVCLNAWQDKEQIDLADELKVIWDKREIIPEILEQYPDKSVVLECFKQELTEEEEQDLKLYNGLSRGKLKICCSNWELFRGKGIPFYIGYPATDFYTLRGMLDAGVCAVRPAGPLILALPSVRKVVGDIEIRVAPNVAHTDGLPHENGIYGSWIRPEALDSYEGIIDVVEFEDIPNKTREQGLYNIYIKDKEWPGDLNLLITNLNYSATNRMINKDFDEYRRNCKAACLHGGFCRICKRMLDLANPDLYKDLK